MKKLILLLLAVGGFYQMKAQIDYNYQINGLSVTFIITQQGQFYEGVEWDFGDGNTSQGVIETEDTVTHIYSSSGNYEVCVIGSPMPMATPDTACKFVDVVSTGINQIDKKSKIVIYPNPFKSATTIIIEDIENYREGLVFTISDISGREIKRLENISNREIKIERTINMQSGIYLYQLIQKGEYVANGKLLIE